MLKNLFFKLISVNSCNSRKSRNAWCRLDFVGNLFVKYVHNRELWVSRQSSGDASLRNSDRTESGMLGKYINGFPTKRREVWRLTGSGVHDASLLAHCWRFLLLYAHVSGYLLHGTVTKSLGDVARQRGTMLNLAFIVNGHGNGHPYCDGNNRNIKKNPV